MLEFGSLPLGAMHDNDYVTHRIQSVPGAMLVLYTDGAIEHSRDVIEGEAILLAAAADAARSAPPDPATFIHDTVFDGRAVGDDVAILTIGFAADPALGVRVSADNAQTAFSGRLGGAAGRTARTAREEGGLMSKSIAVIRLSGELEIGRRAEIAQALVVSGNEAAVLLDFSEVTYADSTSLAEMLRFREDGRRTQRAGRDRDRQQTVRAPDPIRRARPRVSHFRKPRRSADRSFRGRTRMMGGYSELRINRIARPEAARPIRHAVEAFLAASGRVADSQRDDILTAVGEALANVVEHAYEGRDENEIELLARLERRRYPRRRRVRSRHVHRARAAPQPRLRHEDRQSDRARRHRRRRRRHARADDLYAFSSAIKYSCSRSSPVSSG